MCTEGDTNEMIVELLPDISTEKARTWTEWSDWTPCSGACGSGRQSRRRECDLQDALGCVGDTVQIRECNKNDCPINEELISKGRYPIRR